MNNTQFISAVSPVLPLERLAALPIDTIVYILLMVGFGTFETIYSLRYYLRHKDAKELIFAQKNAVNPRFFVVFNLTIISPKYRL